MSTGLLSVMLGVTAMVGWGVYDFLGGVLSRRIGAFTSLLWSQWAGFGCILLVAVAIGPTLPGAAGAGAGAGLPWREFALSALAAGLYCAGYVLFFTGFEKGDVSIVAATMNVWAVFTMLVAFVFMGQRLTLTQTVGAVTVILGASVASVNWSQVGHEGLRMSAGVRETLLGAFFFGVYWNVSEVISEQIGWLATTVWIKFGVVLMLTAVRLMTPVLWPGTRTAVAGVTSTGQVLTLLAMGAIEVGAVAAVNFGLTVGDAILITPIASALSVVTMGLAVLVLRDRVSPLQGLGMALAVAGIVTTAL